MLDSGAGAAAQRGVRACEVGHALHRVDLHDQQDSDRRDVTTSARDVVQELFRRQQSGAPDLDNLVAKDMVNHAAGPQGRDGLYRILRNIEGDLGPLTYEQHHLIANGERLFDGVTHRCDLNLIEARPLRDGSLLVTYAVAETKEDEQWDPHRRGIKGDSSDTVER